MTRAQVTAYFDFTERGCRNPKSNYLIYLVGLLLSIVGSFSSELGLLQRGSGLISGGRLGVDMIMGTMWPFSASWGYLFCGCPCDRSPHIWGYVRAPFLSLRSGLGTLLDYDATGPLLHGLNWPGDPCSPEALICTENMLGPPEFWKLPYNIYIYYIYIVLTGRSRVVITRP